MKTNQFVMVAGLILATSVTAQLTPEQKAEVDRSVAISVRAHDQLLAAQQAAMERCDSTRTAINLPVYDRATKTERTANMVVTIDWKGGCVDGKRDGDGVLSWTEDQENNGAGLRVVTSWRAEGRFVKGQRMGLWCMNRSVEMSMPGREARKSTPPEFCAVYASHAKPLTPGFRKQADGSWLEAVGAGSKLPAGALEAQSARVLSEAAAGKTNTKVELTAKNEIMEDLVPGAKITLALTPTKPSLKGKRVAIVFSSGTLDGLERFKREREALIKATSQMTGESATYRQRFIAASDPGRLMLNVAKTMRRNNVSSEPVEDLAGLQKGRYDYAIVLDWSNKIRLDLLGKYDSFPVYTPGGPKIGPACETVRGFLISRELKAVQQIYGSEHCEHRFGAADKGDLWYMRRLAQFFELQWGKNVDDTGSAMLGFEQLVRG